MQFDPRIVPDDLSEVPDELPSDLAQLGAQLQGEAVHLANRYPASGRVSKNFEPKRNLEPKKSVHGSGGIFAIGAAVVLLALIAASSFFYRPTNSANSKDVVEHKAVTKPNTQVVIEQRKILESDKFSPSESAKFSPALLLPDASGPEQEALLDYLEQESSEEVTFSI